MEKGKFIVLEGVCCSGKTTLSNKIMELWDKEKMMYNHGAMSYSDVGRKYYEEVDKRGVAVSSLFYYADLLQDTKNKIIPSLKNGLIVIQDRYYESVNTYTKAYGDFHSMNLNIYPISELLLKEKFLLTPDVEIFCIPPYEVIKNRMQTSKSTEVHNYYRKNPSFHLMVYEELKRVSEKRKNAIIVDTSDNNCIENGVKKIVQAIGGNKY